MKCIHCFVPPTAFNGICLKIHQITIGLCLVNFILMKARYNIYQVNQHKKYLSCKNSMHEIQIIFFSRNSEFYIIWLAMVHISPTGNR